MNQEQKQPKKSNISIKKLRLSNLQNVKKSLSRIANEILKADIENGDLSRLRSCGYILNILVSAYRIDFENRLEKLEGLINNENKN